MAKTNVSALDIAGYFVFLGDKAERKLTHKKLQKLLYYAQAWSLALKGVPMFKEPIEAWIHGPVIPQVYSRYKKWGYGAIANADYDKVAARQNKDILNEVWRIYGKYDADYLELLTHNEDPWIFARNAYETKNPRKSPIISHDLMRSFYSSLLHKAKAADESKNVSS